MRLDLVKVDPLQLELIGASSTSSPAENRSTALLMPQSYSAAKGEQCNTLQCHSNNEAHLWDALLLTTQVNAEVEKSKIRPITNSEIQSLGCGGRTHSEVWFKLHFPLDTWTNARYHWCIRLLHVIIFGAEYVGIDLKTQRAPQRQLKPQRCSHNLNCFRNCSGFLVYEELD